MKQKEEIEQAVHQLISNFARDAALVIQALEKNTGRPYRSEVPFTDNDEQAKLTGMFSNERVDVRNQPSKS